MDRRVVDLLKNMPERNRFVRGIRSWVGFNQIGIPLSATPATPGRRSTRRAIDALALDGLISFSYVPLRIITGLGLRIFSCADHGRFLFREEDNYELRPARLRKHHNVNFLSGRDSADYVGVIGEYVGRIFEEAKRRPMYVARVRYGFG